VRRWPWLAAGGFGLIHGLGFASALGELGLPPASLASSLFWFNVGVELGQLAIVIAAVALASLGRRLLTDRAAPRLHTAACYTLGTLAIAWLIPRL
jgi:hypothetical protein